MHDALMLIKLQANMVASTLASLRGLVQDDMTEASGLESEFEMTYASIPDEVSSGKTCNKHRHH